jgi:16S rRNA (adenine1518-N6/adenine1519-N6)-dimethyltransferase
MARLSAVDLVLEVGPGLGALTERLLDSGARVIAIELDGGYVQFLTECFEGQARFQLLSGDVLAKKSSIAPQVIGALGDAGWEHGWKLVANLPYQVSSPLISALIQLERPPSLALVMLQREVAEVLLADEGRENYSPLSFLARLYYDVEVMRHVPAGCFYPSPKVASALVRLIPRADPELSASELLPFARLLFQGRRKALRATIPRAIEKLLPSEADRFEIAPMLDEAGIPGNSRIDGIPAAAIARFYANFLRKRTVQG